MRSVSPRVAHPPGWCPERHQLALTCGVTHALPPVQLFHDYTHLADSNAIHGWFAELMDSTNSTLFHQLHPGQRSISPPLLLVLCVGGPRSPSCWPRLHADHLT